MKFAKLDRRVRFLKRANTQNAYGDPVPAWTNLDAADSSLGEVWAEVIYPGSPKETPQAYGIFPERQITFNIRNPRGSFTVLDSYRVDYNGDEFEVIGIQEIGRLDGLRIFCRTVQTG